MTQRTAPAPTEADQDRTPPDLATMRTSVNRLLDPDAAPDALPPTADELETLTLQLRGHLQLLMPEVERITLGLGRDSIPRYCAQACLGEAQMKLAIEPQPGPGAGRRSRPAPGPRPQRTRRPLREPRRGHVVSVTLRICRYCDEPIADPDDAVFVGHEPSNSGPGWDIWAHRTHADLVGPDTKATAILARVLIARALRSE